MKKGGYIASFSNKYSLNENIIVQVSREARENKGPRVKDKIQLKGRYIILNINNKEITISNKNKNFNLEMINTFDGKYGYIVRTNTKVEDIKYIEEEYFKLSKIADEMLYKYKYIKPPF
ncbi:hypothetical protein PL321_15620 [Caloramator sp. mosi_1]|uniref:hypothetical protein n=1 Tax=Caloramator sp. mosi_1 TaxID=3023090 RepID=UPI00236299C6|nr:hypothetical protein [Caloramator sp. mosi_1]WDC83875.1 hypothetical protein PL321_15620 [Caloramator sp. mosi_1]